MEIQFGEIVCNQEEGFFAAVCAIPVSDGEFGLDVSAGLIYGIRQKGDVFVRPLDIVKRRLGLIAHSTPFRPPALICSIVSHIRPWVNGPAKIV
jgi:hypothetical protein